MNFHITNNLEGLNGGVKSLEEKFIDFRGGENEICWHWIYFFDEAGNETFCEQFDESGNVRNRFVYSYDTSGNRVRCKSFNVETNEHITRTYIIEDNGKSVLTFDFDELIEHKLYNERGSLIFHYHAFMDTATQYILDDNDCLSEEIIRYGFRNPNNGVDTRDVYHFNNETGLTLRQLFNLNTGELIGSAEYSLEETDRYWPEFHTDGNVVLVECSMPLLASTEKDHYGNDVLLNYKDYNGDFFWQKKRIITYYE